MGCRLDQRTLGFLTLLASWACLSAPIIYAGEPSNLGDLKEQLIAYHDFGGYENDFKRVTGEAQAYIEQRASHVTHPAVVFDVDETALSNWPEMRANDFGYLAKGSCDNVPKGPCGDDAWEASGRDEAIDSTLALYKETQVKGVAVFFITGRYESVRAATERNLQRVGYQGWVKLVMRPTGTTTESAADYKSLERKKIEDAGYTIIANIGDQPSDLLGGHAERAFLVPDPFYRIP